MTVEDRKKSSDSNNGARELEYNTLPFTWLAESTDSILIVRFRGDLDESVTVDCEAGLAEPLAGPETVVVLDLEKLGFVDTDGLRLLTAMKEKIEARGERLLLNRLPSHIRTLFDGRGLTDWFEYMEGEAPKDFCSVCGRSLWWAAEKCPSCGGPA